MTYHFFCATPEIYRPRFKDEMIIGDLNNEIVETVLYENKLGLSKVYNNFLKSRQWSEKDRVVFLHDDLRIDDCRILEKLTDAHESFDVVGLAGSGGAITKTKIAMWHIMGEKKSGTITHTKDGKYWTNVYGENGIPCKFLDGLFLSVDPLKLLDKDVWFDEDFDFHHYDSSFAVRCNLAGLKIGTPRMPIYVIHEGMGEMTPEFLESNERFKKKYYGV